MNQKQLNELIAAWDARVSVGDTILTPDGEGVAESRPSNVFGHSQVKVTVGGKRKIYFLEDLLPACEALE